MIKFPSKFPWNRKAKMPWLIFMFTCSGIGVQEVFNLLSLLKVLPSTYWYWYEYFHCWWFSNLQLIWLILVLMKPLPICCWYWNWWRILLSIADIGIDEVYSHLLPIFGIILQTMYFLRTYLYMTSEQLLQAHQPL